MRFLGALLVVAAGSAMADHMVAVCMNAGANGSVVLRAQYTAAKILARAGVQIEWRCDSANPSIAIKLSNQTAAFNHPGAFAYALPYQGSHVVVFYDRVADHTRPERMPVVLGHVLAHEITHMLQGVARHSEEGVMKARWNSLDLSAMAHQPLRLTGEDVDLIRANMNRWASSVSDGK